MTGVNKVIILAYLGNRPKMSKDPSLLQRG